MAAVRSRPFREMSEEPGKFVRQLKESGEPVIIQTEGEDIVVQDAASYILLLEQLERAETIAGIRGGLEDMYAGRTKPLDKAFARIRSVEWLSASRSQK